MKVYFRLIMMTLVMVLVNSCDSGLKKSLGITHNSPDEYSVLKNTPLSVPPNFALTPPSDTPVKKQSAVDETISFSKKTNSKEDTKHTKGLSKADKSFMKKFDSHEKRPDIRELITEDAKPSVASKEEKKPGMLSKVKSWF